MAIDLDKAQTKLDAVTAKNAANIAIAGMYLPMLGNPPYTEAIIQTWLDISIDLLDYAIDNPLMDTDDAIDDLYAQLTQQADLDFADKIIAGSSYEDQTATGEAPFNILLQIMLYIFITTDT